MYVLRGHKDSVTAVDPIEERGLTVRNAMRVVWVSRGMQISGSWDGEVRGWQAIGTNPEVTVRSLWVLQAHGSGIEVLCPEWPIAYLT